MTLSGAILELDADVDGTGMVTGTFDLSAELRINSRTVTDYLLSRRLGDVNAIVGSGVDGFGDDRSSYYVDLGAGGNLIEFQKRGWEGASGQWGDGSGNDSRDATGSNPWHQAQMLERYVSRGEYDSRNTRGRLRVGEIDHSGHLDSHIPISVQEYEWTRDTEDGSPFYDITLSLARVAPLDAAIDIAKQELF